MAEKTYVRYIKYGGGLVLLGYGLLALAGLIWNFVDTRNDIASGQLVYERELGWLDITHANTGGATRLLRTIESPEPAGEPTYRQCMGYFGVWACTYASFRLADTTYSESVRVLTAEYIYRETSLAFEAMQAKVPLLFFDLPYSSSFKEGDLKGNLLSFYCAVYALPVDSVVARLDLASGEETLRQFSRHGLGKDRSWDMEAAFIYFDRRLGIERGDPMLFSTRRPAHLDGLRIRHLVMERQERE